jgi:hypothetical protein
LDLVARFNRRVALLETDVKKALDAMTAIAAEAVALAREGRLPQEQFEVLSAAAQIISVLRWVVQQEENLPGKPADPLLDGPPFSALLRSVRRVLRGRHNHKGGNQTDETRAEIPRRGGKPAKINPTRLTP